MDIMVLGFWMPLSLGRVCSFLQRGLLIVLCVAGPREILQGC